jgi:hypothetical protein
MQWLQAAPAEPGGAVIVVALSMSLDLQFRELFLAVKASNWISENSPR